jgi:HAE1 family hydrophobic/amphiphilic exporter-1
MKFAIAAEKNCAVFRVLEIELSVEDGNPEVSVKVDRDKMAALYLSYKPLRRTMQTGL